MTIIRWREVYNDKMEMSATVLEVRRGDSAYYLAKSQLYSCSAPVQRQEYIAIRVRIDVLEAEDPNVVAFYSDWNLTLRYSNGGNDIWPEEDNRKFAEGYPPFSGTGWVFFKIKIDSKPLLYFQPYLKFLGPFYRTSGAYFSLEQP